MRKVIGTVILSLCCGLLLAACTAPKTITELEKIQYIIAHKEDFSQAMQDKGYEITVYSGERHDSNSFFVLTNNLGQEFGFYNGFEYVIQSNLVYTNGEVKYDEQAPTNVFYIDGKIPSESQIKISRWNFMYPPREADQKPVFDIDVNLIIDQDTIAHNTYTSTDFIEYQERFRDENIADSKIKSVLSAEELKALYDKGISLQETLFELYEQEMTTASQP